MTALAVRPGLGSLAASPPPAATPTTPTAIESAFGAILTAIDGRSAGDSAGAEAPGSLSNEMASASSDRRSRDSSSSASASSGFEASLAALGCSLLGAAGTTAFAPAQTAESAAPGSAAVSTSASPRVGATAIRTSTARASAAASAGGFDQGAAPSAPVATRREAPLSASAGTTAFAPAATAESAAPGSAAVSTCASPRVGATPIPTSTARASAASSAGGFDQGAAPLAPVGTRAEALVRASTAALSALASATAPPPAQSPATASAAPLWRGADTTPAGASVAAWDLTGATPLRSLLASDAALGFQGLQEKTHLAVAGSLPIDLDDDRTANGATPTASSAPSAAGAGVLSSPPVSAVAQPPPVAARPFAARAQKPSTNAAGEAPADGAAPASTAAKLSDASYIAQKSSAPAAGGVALAAAVGAGSTAANASSLPPAQLPRLIADQARTLARAPSSSPAPLLELAAQATPGNSKIKELEVSLDPADLGKISIKLKLDAGKLDVSIRVANPATLSAIESERGAIETRLAASSQSLESLQIQAQEGQSHDVGAQASGGSGGYSGPQERQERAAPRSAGDNGRSRGARTALVGGVVGDRTGGYIV